MEQSDGERANTHKTCPMREKIDHDYVSKNLSEFGCVHANGHVSVCVTPK